MPVLADAIDQLSERERQRLYALATVRGYRLVIERARTGRHRHFVAWLAPGRDARARRASASLPTKAAARRALLQLMLNETRRTAA